MPNKAEFLQRVEKRINDNPDPKEDGARIRRQGFGASLITLCTRAWYGGKKGRRATTLLRGGLMCVVTFEDGTTQPSVIRILPKNLDEVDVSD